MNLRSVFLSCLLAISSQAAIFDLKNDFSLSNGNPNGVWSYQRGFTNLTLQSPVLNGNLFISAVATGFWGAGNDLNLNWDPSVSKALVNGSLAGEDTTLDFAAGDIVVASANDSSILNLLWTAPSAGTITGYNGAVWYAHSAVGARSNSYLLQYGASTLASGTVSLANNRTNQSVFSGGPFSVSAGDVLGLQIFKTSGTQFGALSGVNFTVNFNPTTSGVPEPSTVALLGSALAGLAFFRSRKA